MDSVYGAVILAALGGQGSIATLDLRMDYLRPAVAGHDLYATASVDKMNRQIVFVSGRIWQQDESKPTAIGRATFMRGANKRPVVS